MASRPDTASDDKGSFSHHDPEKVNELTARDEYQQVDGQSGAQLKLDSRGLPLVPQPTDDPADPLNWPLRTRIAILLLVSLVAFNTPWSLATSNPAFAVIGKYFGGRTPPQGGYPSTVGIAMAGVGGFFFLPFASVYGRRPTLLVALAVGCAFTTAAGAVDDYGTLIAMRAIAGFFLAAGPAVAGGIVSDLFCLHERGRAAGVFTVFLTNGPHIASIPGGFLAQYVSWRWTLYLPGITTGALFLAALIALPETLYIRLPGVDHHSTSSSPIRDAIFRLPRRAPTRSLSLDQFYKPLLMLRYFVVVAVAFFYGVVFTVGSVLPALTASKTFGTYFGLTTSQIGLAIGLGTTIGGVLGEIAAGPVIDRLMSKRRLAQGGHARTETRLYGMLPAVFLLPAGLLIFGFCVWKHQTVSFMGPVIGAAITCFSVQIVTTPSYSYLLDSFKSQSAEMSQIINFVRQTIAMTCGFWATAFGEKAGYHVAGIVYAVVVLLSFIPVALVMWKGDKWRATYHTDLNKGV